MASVEQGRIVKDQIVGRTVSSTGPIGAADPTFVLLDYDPASYTTTGVFISVAIAVD